MTPQPGRSLEYRAYLLKLWRETDGGCDWRFSLEEIGGGYDRRGFASLEALVEFLEGRILAEGAMPPGGEAWEDRAE